MAERCTLVKSPLEGPATAERAQRGGASRLINLRSRPGPARPPGGRGPAAPARPGGADRGQLDPRPAHRFGTAECNPPLRDATGRCDRGTCRLIYVKPADSSRRIWIRSRKYEWGGRRSTTRPRELARPPGSSIRLRSCPRSSDASTGLRRNATPDQEAFRRRCGAAGLRRLPSGAGVQRVDDQRVVIGGVAPSTRCTPRRSQVRMATRL
jgi:hypothetical protein